MKASVVVPVKNGMPHFGRVLAQLARQETPWPYEVVIVDSGSTDGGLEEARKYPAFKILQIEPKDFGHGRTRNQAISECSGEFVALLTHDALPADEHWLANIVAAVEADPAIAGAFGRHIAYPDADPYTKLELEQHFRGFTETPVVWLEDRQRYTDDQGYRQFLHFYSDNNSCLRRSVWEKIPYPDVDFAEDQLWAQQIIEAGYKKAYAHDAVVYHSHDFALFERLQRAFDESQSFRKLFGYRLGGRLLGALARAGAMSVVDLRYALKSGLWRTAPGAVIKRPFDNLMRQLGYYLGARENLAEHWGRWLSRDKRLFRMSGSAAQTAADGS